MSEKDVSFPTLVHAMQAGYRRAVRGLDEDISSPGSYGYAFRSPDGEETVIVWLTHELSVIGVTPCFLPMFPPRIGLKEKHE